MSNFFTETLPKYWSPSGLIQATPPATWAFRWEYAALTLICLLIAVVSIFLKIRPSVKARIQALAWTNGLIGILLYFCRDQRIPYIGMDLLRFIQEVTLIFWINSIVLFARKAIPQEILSEQVQARREKYLPKKSA
jgi:hypothetical protein